MYVCMYWCLDYGNCHICCFVFCIYCLVISVFAVSSQFSHHCFPVLPPPPPPPLLPPSPPHHLFFFYWPLAMGCHRCGQTTEASVRHAQLSANGRTFFYLSEGTVKALDVACKGSLAFSFMSCVSSHSNCLKMVFAYFHKYPVPYENDSNSQNANNISGCTSYN